MKRNKKIVLLVSFIILSVLIGNYNASSRENKLQGITKETMGVFDHTVVVYNTGPMSYFNYNVGNQQYELSVSGRFEHLKKGTQFQFGIL